MAVYTVRPSLVECIMASNEMAEATIQDTRGKDETCKQLWPS